MGPAQRAVARVHPQLAHFRGPHQRDVGGRGGAQAAPELRVAALLGCAGVGHAGEHLFDAAHQHFAAGAGQRGVQAQVKAAQLDGASHAQLVAQPGNGAFHLVVNHADRGRCVGVEQGQRGAVALAGVNGHVHAHLLQQRGGVAARGHHKGVGRQCAGLARGAVAHGHVADVAAGGVQALDVVPHQGLQAFLLALAGQRLGEHPAIARFVAFGVGAAHDAVGKTPQRGLDAQQLFFAHHPAGHAVAAHGVGGGARLVKRLLAGVVVGNAPGQAVVVDAGVGHDVFQRRVAVLPQRHQLRHVALKSRVVALRQKLQAPLPLRGVELGAKFQGAFGVEHPLQGLQRRGAVGPRFAVADRNLRRVAKAGFQGRVGLAVHQRDLVPALQQMPGGADADDARAQDGDSHDENPTKFSSVSGGV